VAAALRRVVRSAAGARRVALAIACRPHVLETGRVTAQGSGSELLNDPKVRAAYLGSH
jgi:ABC-type branched-subunit amino acid transport system ATPase component